MSAYQLEARAAAFVAPAGDYAQRAATAYLEAYERQNGTRQTIACPMLAAQAKLSNVYNFHGTLGIEPLEGEWSGMFWRRYALAVIAYGAVENERRLNH